MLVLSQCNTRLRLLHLLYDIEVITRFFYVLYSNKTWVFEQSERAQGVYGIVWGHNEQLWQVLVISELIISLEKS